MARTVRLREAAMREIDRRLRHADLISLADYGVLITLVTAPGLRLRMSDLGAQRMLTPSGITRVVVRLEEQGLSAGNPPGRRTRRVRRADPARTRGAAARAGRPPRHGARALPRPAPEARARAPRRTLREGATGRRQRFRLAASISAVGFPDAALGIQGRVAARSAVHGGAQRVRPRGLGARRRRIGGGRGYEPGAEWGRFPLPRALGRLEGAADKLTKLGASDPADELPAGATSRLLWVFRRPLSDD